MSAVFIMSELERHVHERTGRRVRDLHVELEHERIVLHGKAGSYYVKQLAQSGVRDMLPEMTVENDIVVGTIS
jgi:hypothetical protein